MVLVSMHKGDCNLCVINMHSRIMFGGRVTGGRSNGHRACMTVALQVICPVGCLRHLVVASTCQGACGGCVVVMGEVVVLSLLVELVVVVVLVMVVVVVVLVVAPPLVQSR